MTVEPVEIEVFSQDCCTPCSQVEAYLTERGVPFIKRDVASDPEALSVLIAQGYMTTPVTRVGNAWVAGFRPRKLDQLLSGIGHD